MTGLHQLVTSRRQICVHYMFGTTVEPHGEELKSKGCSLPTIGWFLDVLSSLPIDTVIFYFGPLRLSMYARLLRCAATDARQLRA